MFNFREINDDILKEWFDFRENTYFCYINNADRSHELKFDRYYEKILEKIPDNCKVDIQALLDLLYDDFMLYCDYWNEKYFRNVFVDGSQLAMGCFEK